MRSQVLTFQGHHEVVGALLDAGALVDRQDRNQWTSLMWAMTNRHKDIAKTLLDHGASPDTKSSSGRTAFDFAVPNSEMSEYLHENGYQIGNVGVAGDDFYDSGFSQDRFEQEMEENEMKRRMMMESSMNLEVDLSSLGMDERPEVRSSNGCTLSVIVDESRHPTRRRTHKPLSGTDVSMIKCLYSKKTTSSRSSTR